MKPEGRIWCAACGYVMPPGMALRCTPTDGAPPFYLHRPVRGFLHCIAAARSVHSTTIALADPAAARAFDHANPEAPDPRRPTWTVARST